MNQTELKNWLAGQAKNSELPKDHHNSIAECLADYIIWEIVQKSGSPKEIFDIIGRVNGIIVVHPRHQEDVYKRCPFLKSCSQDMERAIREALWPLILDVVDFGDRRMFVITLPLTYDYFVPPINEDGRIDKDLYQEYREKQKVFAQKQEDLLKFLRIMESAAKIPIVLGALTGRMARYLKQNGITSPLITGIYITPGIIEEMIEKIAAISEESAKDWQIALVGGAGNMGQNILSWLLEKGFKHLTIIEATENEITALRNRFPEENLTLTTDIKSGVRNKDLVIVATASPKVLIEKEMLSSGTIVIDDTHPSNVASEITGKGVLVLRVMASVPGIRYRFPMDQLGKNDVVTCIAEGITVSRNPQKLFPLYQEDFVSSGQNAASVLTKALAEATKSLGIHSDDLRDNTGYIADKTIKSIRSLRKL